MGMEYNTSVRIRRKQNNQIRVLFPMAARGAHEREVMVCQITLFMTVSFQALSTQFAGLIDVL